MTPSVDTPAGGSGPRVAGRVPPELAACPEYDVVRELGRGGMGVVYLARNRLIGRLEALKVMTAPHTVGLFLREIHAAGRLAPPERRRRSQRPAGRRRAGSGHGVRGRAGPAAARRDPRADGRAVRLRVHSPGRPRAAARSGPRHRPPGREARQPDRRPHRGRGRREDPRLRPGRGRRRRGRGRAAGHPGVRRPGADGRPDRRRHPVRHLRPRRHPVLPAHRPAAVRVAQHDRGVAAAPRRLTPASR